jgi:hypothetical protein
MLNSRLLNSIGRRSTDHPKGLRSLAREINGILRERASGRES